MSFKKIIIKNNIIWSVAQRFNWISDLEIENVNQLCQACDGSDNIIYVKFERVLVYWQRKKNKNYISKFPQFLVPSEAVLGGFKTVWKFAVLWE